MNANVLFAVFKRNFTSYFSSPLGYVFILVFVFLSTGSVVLSPEFFNVNLANLDQLNKAFPYIMLIFVPAITMGIWADEKRQGTDELLLTLPASDLDIVLGKYLAGVSIYTVSLLYSLVCNFAVLKVLGNPDIGLITGTYFGYWLVGLAMLGIGMTASFLTTNLTVAFILGLVFNVPLLALNWIDTVVAGPIGLAIKQWSIVDQFRDFGRGVITFSGLIYFAMIVAVSLYVSMILIARRHWFTGEQRHALVLHYAVRALALLGLTIGLNALFNRNDVRLDVTSEKLSSLSATTRDMLDKLDPKAPPIVIEAFISPNVPESYVQTRMTLLNTLRELQARGHGRVRVRINDTERFTDEAERAKQRYGIEPRQVTFQQRGAYNDEYLFLHVAVTSGLQKVPPVFFDRGIPVEYELVRSVGTMAQTKRKKIGVVNTDAPLFGRFDFQTGGSGGDWPVIEELKKQYDVVQLDLAKWQDEKCDAVLAVQPSSLSPEDMDRFVDLVSSGMPTAIFEDPFPRFIPGIPGTAAPKQPPGGMNPMMMMQQPRTPKGDITRLWDVLGVDFTGDQVVFQHFNPYPRMSWFNKEPEFVFVDEGAGEVSNEDEITSKLKQLLFPFPGSIRDKNTSKLKFVPLVTTGTVTGTIQTSELRPGPRGELDPRRQLVPRGKSYILAAEIVGDLPDDKQPDGANAETKPGTAAPEAPAPKTAKRVHVVLVADLDMLTQPFFEVRAMGENSEAGVHFNFDNITFILNAVDKLSGDDRFIELRKRRPVHRTLKTIDKWTEEARKEADKSREKYNEQFKEREKEARDEYKKRMDAISKDADAITRLQDVVGVQMDLQRRMSVQVSQLEQERDRDIATIRKDLKNKLNAVQNTVKTWTMFLPPAPLLALAIVVWAIRRSRESEGVSRSRMR